MAASDYSLFTAECRNCDHEIKQTIPVTEIVDNFAVRIRCAKCDTTNYTEDSNPKTV